MPAELVADFLRGGRGIVVFCVRAAVKILTNLLLTWLRGRRHDRLTNISKILVALHGIRAIILYMDAANGAAAKQRGNKMNVINFVIKANGNEGKAALTCFIAEDAKGKLLATISPRMMPNAKFSERFLNVCFMDGTVEIADREDGETEISNASELIAAKLFS